LDLNAVPVTKQLSNLPIFVDPSHGIGIANKVPAMALAGIAAGADGLIIEVHNAPEKALSDGMQSITPIQFKVLLNKVKAIATILERE
jgi:3-deoxy-7-phosphoheptulonate synthase